MKKTFALGLLLLISRAWGEPVAGSLDVLILDLKR